MHTGKPRVFVLAKSRHFGHELSFEKFSNCAWKNSLHFNNGGLAVNLLKLAQKSKLSPVKQTISAYKQLGTRKGPPPSLDEEAYLKRLSSRQSLRLPN